MQLTANHRVLKIPCPRNAIFMAHQDGSFDLIFDLGSHGFVLDWFLRIGAELARILLPQVVNPPQQASAPSHVTAQAAVSQPVPQPQGSQPSQFAAFQAAATVAPAAPVSSGNQPVSLPTEEPNKVALLQLKIAELEAVAGIPIPDEIKTQMVIGLAKTSPTPQEPVEQPKPESD